MIATLPMYDRAETAAAQDRLYAAFRETIPNAPQALSRNGTHWGDPELLLSQTCSLPFRVALHDVATLVATPVHALDCPAGLYYSEIIVRSEDNRENLKAYSDATLAINSPLSQSGWAAIDAMAQADDIRFASVVQSGSHAESARMVADGRADIASIDAVTWTMIRRWDAHAKDLRVLTRSEPSPALPFITSIRNNPAPIQSALVDAIHGLSAEDQEALCLVDVTYIPFEQYVSLPVPPPPCLLSETA